jgi:hypothetical protein
MKRRIVAAALILGGMLNAAHADTWVFRDTLRPGGHDHVIPDPPSAHARNYRHDNSPWVDNNDDSVQRQRDQDNTQQMLNTQQMINDQQMQNDQMFQQQQQQMINDMNNH